MPGTINCYIKHFSACFLDAFCYKKPNMKSFSFNCTTLVKTCYYGGLEIENCCANAKHIMTDMGKCIQFGSIENYTSQVVNGAAFGFELVMDINVTDSPSKK